jgi:alpha-galactosidase
MTLREELKGVLAGPLLRAMDDGPGWRIESGSAPLVWAAAGGVNREGDEASAEFTCEAAGLAADVRLRRDPRYQAAVLQVTLHNTAESDCPPISAVKPWYVRFSGLPRGDLRVRSLGGGTSQYYYPPDAYRERSVAVRPGIDSSGCGGDRIRIESGRDGRSSNKDLPFLQLSVGGGVGAIVALEWSGMWHQELGYDWAWDPLLWEAGVPVEGMRLGPRESLELPAVHLVCFAGDEEAGGNAFRRYLSERICPRTAGAKTIPWIGYDHWFGIENVFDEKLLRRQVDRCAELGVEVFTIDSGWHAGCGPGKDHWAITEGIGNWERACPLKFPSGIAAFIDYVHAKGMKFGLWFEPERAHRSSDLYRAHPEWCIGPEGKFPHLDFALPAVQDHMIAMFERWIERGLDWARWDYNTGPRGYLDVVDPTGRIQFDYFRGVYRVLDTVIARHPKFIFEGCASGGRRIDLGLLGRSWTYWFSDHTHDPLICRFMQCGANRFLPGHIANSAVAVMAGSGAAGFSDVDVLGRMSGTFFLSGDVASWGAPSVERLKELLSVYRRFRHLLIENFHALTPQPASLDAPEAVEFVDAGGREAVVLGYAGIDGGRSVTVRLRGLGPSGRYAVEDPLGGRSTTASAHSLADEGIPLDLSSGVALRLLKKAD